MKGKGGGCGLGAEKAQGPALRRAPVSGGQILKLGGCFFAGSKLWVPGWDKSK